MSLHHIVELDAWLTGLAVFFFILGLVLSIQYSISLWMQGRRLLTTASAQADEICKALLSMPFEDAKECAAELRRNDPAMYILVASKLQRKR